MPVRPPSRRLVRRLVVGGIAAALAVTSFAMAGLMADAAPTTRTTAVPTPRLVARATLSADHLAPGPQSGALATPANGRAGPFGGQVIPGFSAAVDNGNGTFWAMPDNGFGTKANSADFRLRIYLVKPHWERASGGAGAIQVLRHVELSDPRHRIDFPIVNENTRTRPLTGADFDVESLQRAGDGTFWIGDEFGPFLLHVDARGRVLSAPIDFPYGKSPQNPRLGSDTPAVRASGGFEALAKSRDGRYLYPVVENSLTTDPDPRRRLITEFDTRSRRYTGRTWDYRVDTDANLIGDAQLVGRNTLLVLERDNFDGAAAVTKRVYRVELGRNDRSTSLAKSLVVDLLALDNPGGIGEDDGWGTGDPFSFGFVSVETIVPLGNGKLLVANDNNYPGNAARNPGTPDDTEMIIVNLNASTRIEQRPPTVNAHRGASGYRPEHTLAAYELAIRQCADVIEPDVVSTSDGVLVARHENEISGTTDVASRIEFAGRRTTKTIDGVAMTGWFTEDFTLAELRTLRAVERLPQIRSANTAFNGLYQVPTVAEVFDLARHSRTCTGKPVGVAPETKHPTYFADIGLPLEERLVAELDKAGLNRSSDRVHIQSFEVGNLQRLDRLTDVRLVQLVNCSGAPYDLRAAGDPRTYADLITPAGLRQIARYADEVGLCKDRMIPRDAAGNLLQPTSVIADAHAVGLEVVGWTFRRENSFLPADYRVGTDPAGIGDLAGEINRFLDAGMDSYFTDNPDIGDEVVRSR
jgi:glycerophosphoryl diester phosphodiesterase